MLGWSPIVQHAAYNEQLSMRAPHALARSFTVFATGNGATKIGVVGGFTGVYYGDVYSIQSRLRPWTYAQYAAAARERK